MGGALVLAAGALGLLGVSHSGLSLDTVDKLILDSGALVVGITGLISAIKAHKTQAAVKETQAAVNAGVTVAQDVQRVIDGHLQRVEVAYQGFTEQGKATVAALDAIAAQKPPLETGPQARGG